MPIERIPGIHGAQDGEIGIGVESLDEPLSLVIEVAGNVEAAANEAAAMVIEAPGVFAVTVGIAGEALIKQRRRTCS